MHIDSSRPCEDLMSAQIWLRAVQAHAEDLERLYRLFHGIVDVHARLVDLLHQLHEGFFIQCSVQSLMLVTSHSHSLATPPEDPLTADLLSS